MRAVLILSLIILRGLFSAVENLFDSEETCLVDGVHLLTGQYIHRQSYLTLPGPEPLPLGHSFQPGWEAKMGGWNILPQSRLEVVRYGRAPGQLRLFAADSRGHQHVWRERRGQWRPDLASSAVLPTGPQAARLDPARDTIQWRAKPQHERVVQRLAHGGRRVYRLRSHRISEGWMRPLLDEEAPSEAWLYELEEERLPSGNLLRCQFNEEGILNRLEVCDRDGQVCSSLTCAAKPVGAEDLELQLLLPDQRSLLFRLHDFRGLVAGRPQADLMLPVQVSGDEIVPQEWSYRADLRPWTDRVFGNGDLYTISGITSVRGPDGRALHMILDDQQRVSVLQRSTGEKGELESVYRFTYGGTDQERWTEVAAADGGVQRVEFNAARLPTQMSWVDQQGRLQRRLRWTWSDHRPARLLHRELLNQQGLALSMEDYVYDGHGRLIAQHRAGRLQPLSQSELEPVTVLDQLEARRETVRGALERALQQPERLPFHVQTIQWSYNKENQVVRQVQSDGATLTFEYLPGTDRCQAEYTWLQGRVVRRAFFTYDRAGQLIEEVRDDGSACDPSDLTAVQSRQRQVRTLSAQLPGLCCPLKIECWGGLPGQEVLKTATEMTYTLGERPARQEVLDPLTGQRAEQSWAYHQGRLIWHRDPVGAERRYRYDLHGNCIDQFGPRPNEWIHRVYDTRNRCMRQTSSDGRQILQHSWTYDALDRVRSHRTPWGAEEGFDYDTLGRLIAQYAPDPSTGRPGPKPSACWSWDAQGAQTEQRLWEGGRWETTRWLRGGEGLPLVCAYPDGTLEGWAYDLQLRPIWTRSRQGQESWTLFDGLGHPLERWAEGQKTTYCWTGDLLLSTRDPLGEQTLFLYDPFGRVCETWRCGTPTRCRHDGWDRLIASQTGQRLSCWSYDAVGRCLQRTEGTAEAVQATCSWRYGPVGDWLEARQEGSTPSITRRDFDLAGRLLASQDARGATTRIEWTLAPDAAHSWRCIEQLPDGRSLIRLFDHAERLTSVSCTKGPDTLWVEHHRHDNLGRSTQVALEQQGQTLLVRARVLGPGGQVLSLTETPAEATTRWDYDADGRLAAVTRPEGQQVRLAYDPAGRLWRHWSDDGSVDQRLTLDALGRVVQAQMPWGRQAQTWDPRGWLACEELEGIGSWSVERGESGECQRWQGSGCLVSWSWDGFQAVKGRLKSPVADEEVGLQRHDALHCPRTWQYSRWHQTVELDALLRPRRVRGPLFEQQITQWTESGHWKEGLWHQPRLGARGREILHWGYDSSGHLVAEQDRHMTVNALHARTSLNSEPTRLWASAFPVQQGACRLQWDRNGCCTQIEHQGEEWRLEWDALDRLRCAHSSQRQITFDYDVWGRLVRRREGSDTLLFQYCGEQMLAVVREGEVWVRACLPHEGAETGSTVLMHSPQGAQLLQSDLQGSLLTRDTSPYTAWGESSQPAAPWGYRSKWHDPALGLVWMGKRWYAPELGMFLSRDPLGVPDGLSTHAYLRHNPLGCLDAWGLELEIYPMQSFQLPSQEEILREWAQKRGPGVALNGAVVDSGPLAYSGGASAPSHFVLRRDATIEEQEVSVVHVLAPGVATPLDTLREYAGMLAEQSGGHAIYSPWRVNSSLAGNLWDIAVDKCFDSTPRLDDCRELAQHMAALYGKQRVRPIVSVISHSAGVRSAEVFVQQMRDLGWGDQVIALGLGGASLLPHEACREAMNIRHSRDWVPLVACLGRADQITAVGEPGPLSLEYHSFLGSEYQGAVKEHLQRVRAAATGRSRGVYAGAR